MAVDFISRDKAIEAIRDRKVRVTGMHVSKNIMNDYARQLCNGYVDILQSIPSENAILIKYGKWIDIGKTDKGTPIRMCSNCKLPKAGKPKSRFCPDCGSFMQRMNDIDDNQLVINDFKF